jgi:hypothetical protein
MSVCGSFRQNTGFIFGAIDATGGILITTGLVLKPEQHVTVITAIVAGPCHLMFTEVPPWGVKMVPLCEGEIDH